MDPTPPPAGPPSGPAETSLHTPGNDATAGRRAAPGRRTILMDFDGVIVREDSLGAFLRHHLVRTPWRVPGFLAATSALVPMIGVPATRSRGLKLLLRAGFAGLSLDRYRERAAAFGTALAAQPGALLRPGVDAALAHLADGDRVVVVTGSEETLARAVLDAAGLQDAELIGSQIGSTPLGLAFRVHAYGPAKVVELRERGIEPPWDVAYSDSAADLPMLRGSRSAVLVNVGVRSGARVRSALPGRVTDVVWR
ncbi:HAD family hydrolase [Patulibacter sp.]|uniref:HAD family hydrolase n=1 Tax=Patulibacter sp. TaxID=1912859 RepID=UPI0027232D57|nr:HAD family hydrolase [Patulibacter sp.]MDO9406819.1 HAD family hydrolase [Patulibacter sp.]